MTKAHDKATASGTKTIISEKVKRRKEAGRRGKGIGISENNARSSRQEIKLEDGGWRQLSSNKDLAIILGFGNLE